MTTVLMKYEAARYALQICEQIDEVKGIRDKAAAMAAYARMAKDLDLLNWSTKLKLRGERKLGEMLAETERSVGGRPGKTGQGSIPVSDNTVKTLEEIGLSKQQSSDFQAIAAIPEDKFEKLVEAGKTSTAALVKASPKTKAAAKAAKAKAGPFAAALEESTEKKAARAPKEKPAKKEEDEFAPNLVNELERAQQTILSQQAVVESLNKSDLAAEVVKWRDKFDRLEGRLQQLMTTEAEARKQATYATGLLAQIRKLLKVEANAAIIPEIKNLLK